MTTMYMQGSYEDYKFLEKQLEEFKDRETTHTSTGGFYHNSFRLKWGDLTIEFHGPIVKAAENLQDGEA